MLSKIKKWFSKESTPTFVNHNEDARFFIVVDKIKIGELKSHNGKWIFTYTNEFKKHLDEYNLIVGFPDVNKEYESESLWPFFQIRIPGLKQPSVQKIIRNENIDQENEVELLKRFGHKTIANPYELEVAE